MCACFHAQNLINTCRFPTRFAFIENIISNALPVLVENNVTACRDPKDDKYLSLALAVEASCRVSGDADLLVMHPFQGIPILRPIEFLDNY